MWSGKVKKAWPCRRWAAAGTSLSRGECLRCRVPAETPPWPPPGAGPPLQAGAEGYLGRAAGGTCFDFCPSDPRTYLVGTEDGGVHKCSTAFSEQYIQSYYGHLAPVYQACLARPGSGPKAGLSPAQNSV